MDLLCFLLSGKPASGTLTAEIGFMFDDWFRPNAMLEFPVGGSGAIVDCLVRTLHLWWTTVGKKRNEVAVVASSPPSSQRAASMARARANPMVVPFRFLVEARVRAGHRC